MEKLKRNQDLDSTGAVPALCGVNPREAVAAVKNRVALWREGNRPADGRKIALVVEGGAMRGVCSAGGVMALAQLGLTDIFDEIYATSAGAMNASYFLSNQVKLGITIYFDNCTSRLFLNPFRVWKILDIDYLFDRIIAVEKRLDVDRIMASPTGFFVSVIDSSTGEEQVIDGKNANAPLLQVLKAATAVPPLYNRTVSVNGRSLIDGGLLNPLPVEAALANGCTDLVVLLTRPVNFRHGKISWIEKRLFGLLCARGNAALCQAHANSDERSHIIRDLALGRASTPEGVNILAICTDEPEMIDHICSDRDLLKRAATVYGRKTLQAFDSDAAVWDISC